jgi:hypothetical protein
MADTIVDYRFSDKTLAEMQAGVTLVTNTASEQFVLKQLCVVNANSRRVFLKTGNYPLLKGILVGNYDGAELIGEGQAVSVETSDFGYFNKLTCFTNSSTLKQISHPTVFFDEGSVGKVGVAVDTAYGVTLTVAPNFACFAANGDFFYANNSTTPLYRRAGGINGTQTTITCGPAVTYDGERYIYSMTTAGVLYRYDTHTQTADTKTITLPETPDISIMHCSALDGWLLYRPNLNTVRIINYVSGVVYSAGPSISEGNTQRYSLALCKNSNGVYYVAVAASGSPVKFLYWSIGANPAAAAFGAVKQDSTLNVVNPWAAYNRFSVLPHMKAAMVIVEGNTTRVFNFDTFNWATITFTYSSGSGPAAAFMVLGVDVVKESDDWGTISARAVGIKTT